MNQFNDDIGESVDVYVVIDETFKPKFEVKVWKKRRNWIAFCKEIKTFGYSEESKEAALKDFNEAVKIYYLVQEKLSGL